MIIGNKRVQEIKRQQRESQLYRIISTLWTEAQVENAQLADLYVNRVALAPDGKNCTILFFSPQGESFFKERLPEMTLFKPSMRAALAKEYQRRYIPELMFKYDVTFEKQQELDRLIQQVAQEDTTHE